MTRTYKLRCRKRILIKPTGPFSFEKTFYKPDHFPSRDCLWKSGKRWQTMLWDGEPLGLRFKSLGTVEKPLVELVVFSKRDVPKESADTLVEELKYRYNLGFDLSEFYRMFGKDPVLGPTIREMRGMRPGHQNSLYEYIMIGIVLQNATVKRSVQMLSALLEKFGSSLEFDNKRLLCFWKPGTLRHTSEDELRKMKLGYRAKTVLRIDEQFREGLINETALRDRDIETQKNALLGLYGVGPATALYLLFDIFQRWDCLDHISPWEQKIYSKLFFDRDPENPVPVGKLIKYFNRYKGYRHLAVNYVWEDLWWERERKRVGWLEKEIRL